MKKEEELIELDCMLGVVARNSPCSKNHIKDRDDKGLEALVNLNYIVLDEVLGVEYTITSEGMRFYLSGGFEKQIAQNKLEMNGLK